MDVDFRRQLAAGGLEGIQSSEDTMIQFTRLVDDEFRAIRKETEELQEIERQAYAEIAEAIFATRG